MAQDTCPVCQGPKNTRSKLCRACWLVGREGKLDKSLWDKDIIALYEQGLGTTAIAKRLPVSSAYASKVARREGVNRGLAGNGNRKAARYDAFRAVEDEATAYWLGFLLADGSLSRGRQVSLCINDRDHVQRFKEWMQAEHAIIQDGDAWRISFTHQGMTDDLAQFGCVQHKSLVLEWPAIPGHLERHLVRGYFDGDGSINWSKGGSYHTLANGTRKRYDYIKPSFSIISGSQPFLECCAHVLGLEVNRTKRRYWRVRTGSRAELCRIYRLLYDSATVYLPRKREAFQAVLEWC
jgi:hypothetical protein